MRIAQFGHMSEVREDNVEVCDHVKCVMIVICDPSSVKCEWQRIILANIHLLDHDTDTEALGTTSKKIQLSISSQHSKGNVSDHTSTLHKSGTLSVIRL